MSNSRNLHCILAAFCLIIPFINGDEINIDQVKTFLPDITLPDLGNSTATIEDMKKLFKEKCAKISGSDEHYEEIVAGAETLVGCLTPIINITAIQVEVDEATPKGELDAVFNKYCLKRPDVLTCMETFSDKLKPCLEEEEQEYQGVFLRIIKSLLNFVCYKEGDQIALFIAEKGPECLNENKDTIANCVNETFSVYIPTAQQLTLDNLPKLVIGKEQCDNMNQLKHCVVDALSQCEEITPANIVDSMFRFIRNETRCPEPKSSGAHWVSTSSHVIIGMQAFLSLLLFSFNAFRY